MSGWAKRQLRRFYNTNLASCFERPWRENIFLILMIMKLYLLHWKNMKHKWLIWCYSHWYAPIRSMCDTLGIKSNSSKIYCIFEGSNTCVWLTQWRDHYLSIELDFIKVRDIRNIYTYKANTCIYSSSI